MDILTKADTFFFVTTIATIILTVVITIAVLYFIRILSTFRDIGDMIQHETKYMAEELKAFRERMREKRSGLIALFTLIRHVLRHYRY
jgi:hypothetical protein